MTKKQAIRDLKRNVREFHELNALVVDPVWLDSLSDEPQYHFDDNATYSEGEE
jgi:hypothetical protein